MSKLRDIIGSRWFRALTIVIAGIAAHGGCLHATLSYADDNWQIRDSEYVEGGQWWAEPALLLTHLSYYLTWKLAGFSTVAFHLGNLTLHLLFALSIYWLARYLLAIASYDAVPDWEWVAWVAALIFVVHPLTSEITNYGRARDHGLVGFFSFLAAGFTALAARRGWRWGAAAALAIVLAAFSKGPGLPHALLNCAIIAVVVSRRGQWRAFFARRGMVATAVGAAVVGLCLIFGHVANLSAILARQITDPRNFALNALNQSRVLPQYLWRMVLPLKLCSDHLIVATRDFADVGAWMAVIAVLVFIYMITLLWLMRLQPWALLATLALAALLLRWLYVVSELMVEYRTYPAMPFVAMLMALSIYHLRQWRPRVTVLAVSLLLLTFTTLSHRRSLDWRSSATLQNQILQLYPLQLRAMNGLSRDDLGDGRYQAVLERVPEFKRRFFQVVEFNQTHPHRNYLYLPGWALDQECLIDEANAHVSDPILVLRKHDMVAWRMDQSHIVHEFLWSQWHFVAGKIAALAGDRKRALYHFAAARQHYMRKLPVDREIHKILPGYASEIFPPALARKMSR